MDGQKCEGEYIPCFCCLFFLMLNGCAQYLSRRGGSPYDWLIAFLSCPRVVSSPVTGQNTLGGQLMVDRLASQPGGVLWLLRFYFLHGINS